MCVLLCMYVFRRACPFGVLHMCAHVFVCSCVLAAYVDGYIMCLNAHMHMHTCANTCNGRKSAYMHACVDVFILIGIHMHCIDECACACA